MIEAGLVAIAILIVGIAWIVFYRKEQAANREEAKAANQRREEVHIEVAAKVAEQIRHLESATAAAWGQMTQIERALAPLCESLAESLTARMSTIDSDMADLRTRVETGPGRRTLKL